MTIQEFKIKLLLLGFTETNCDEYSNSYIWWRYPRELQKGILVGFNKCNTSIYHHTNQYDYDSLHLLLDSILLRMEHGDDRTHEP